MILLKLLLTRATAAAAAAIKHLLQWAGGLFPPSMNLKV
jgi:hypothetical protein